MRKAMGDANIVGISLLMIMCGMGLGEKLVGSQRILQMFG